MSTAGNKGPDRVRQALTAAGLEVQVSELPESTRTAAEAARAVDCAVGQIAKSLVFKGKSGTAYLVIASGSNQVDIAKLTHLIDEKADLADPDFVREQTGFAIGGVPPLGHRVPLPTLFDEDLLQFDEIWAAAGSPRAVFPIDPAVIIETTNAQVVEIRQET